MQDLRHDEVQEALQSMDITIPLLETIQHDGIDLTEDESIFNSNASYISLFCNY